jgi:NAD(P)H-dependent FMN reductase
MVHTFNSDAKPSVLLITASVRPRRHGPQIAAWVLELAAGCGLNIELVELADWKLPMDDEPEIPQTGIYTQEHTKAWSRKIAGAGGFIFVTPQYNWGYPAPLKNALDHLYAEWSGKPAVIISYGGHGGGKCAVQLRQVIEAMKMRPVAAMPAITLSNQAIRGGDIDPPKDLQDAAGSIRQAAAELAAALSE